VSKLNCWLEKFSSSATVCGVCLRPEGVGWRFVGHLAELSLETESCRKRIAHGGHSLSFCAKTKVGTWLNLETRLDIFSKFSLLASLEQQQLKQPEASRLVSANRKEQQDREKLVRTLVSAKFVLEAKDGLPLGSRRCLSCVGLSCSVSLQFGRTSISDLATLLG